MLRRLRNRNPTPDAGHRVPTSFTDPSPDGRGWRGAPGEGREKEVVIVVSGSHCDCRTFLPDPSFLFKGMCDLQDAEIIAVTANNLDTDWQPVRCEARWA